MRKMLFVILLLLPFASHSQTSLISYKSIWKYLANGSNQGTVWRGTGFNDASWSSGTAELGYGDGDEATVVSSGPASAKYITTYFRKTISLTNIEQFSNFRLNLKRDDGAVVYINGIERMRSNMPTGTISYTTKALSEPADDGKTAQTVTLPLTYLNNGTNVIAVEVHQFASNGTDLSFDLELQALPDITAPTVKSINRLSPITATINATSVVFRVTFSEKVTGVDVTDFKPTIVSGTLSATISGMTPVGTTGSIYDVTVNSINGTGVLRLDLKASSTGIQDIAKNNISSGYIIGQTYSIDQTAPTIKSINRLAPNTTATINNSYVIFSVTFSEKVTGLSTADFMVTTVSGNVTGVLPVTTESTATTYNVTVNSLTGSGVLRLDLKSNGTGIKDVVGNNINGGYTSGQTYNIDRIAPYVQSILRQSPTSEVTTSPSVTFRTTFSEKVNGVDITDFIPIIVSGSLTAKISGITAVGTSGTTYDVKVDPVTGTGVLRLDIKSTGTGIIDAVTNAISGGYSSGESYRFGQSDITPPMVQSILRQSPTSETVTASQVTFRATFSEKVTGLDAIDFTTTTLSGNVSGILTADAITAIGTEGTTYDITVTSITGEGILRLDLNASGTGIKDESGNEINEGYNNSETYTFESNDHTPPIVQTINRQSPVTATVNSNEVTFRITFSETVTGIDATDLTTTVETGMLSAAVSEVTSITGNIYDVKVSSIHGNGVLRLDLNSNETNITDASGNLIDAGYTNGQTYIIDQIAPVIGSINRYSPLNYITDTDMPSVIFRVSFSEAVNNVDVTDFSVTTISGTLSTALSSVTPVNANTYDVAVNFISGTGELRLDLKSTGTGIKDVATNIIAGGYNSGQTYTYKVLPEVKPLFITETVQYDSDDPAIWINNEDPSQSLIIGTDKSDLGALYVFDMTGKIIQTKVVKNISKPNNVDVAYGLLLNGRKVDIAITTERLTKKLRIFSIPDMQAIDNGGIDVFVGETLSGYREPMGIGLYTRPTDGAIYAIVSRKSGPVNGTYLWQYLLQDDGTGNVKATLVRKFGMFSGSGEIEAVAVDNELGFVYYSDETAGVRKYYADPAKGNEELAFFAKSGFAGQREGISMYKIQDGTGYILVMDQSVGLLHVFPREGTPGKPHDHPLIKTVPIEAHTSDGSDMANTPILPNFPNGIFVAMSTDKTFHLYRWEDIAGNDLQIHPTNITLAAPTLASPIDAAFGVDISPSLSWNASAGSVSYQVQVSPSPEFTNITLDQSSVTTTSIQVSGLAENTVYYWKVRAMNSTGISNWSSVWSFTTTTISTTQLKDQGKQNPLKYGSGK